jgi:hypothetical protein
MDNGRRTAMKELVRRSTGIALEDLLRDLYVGRRHSQQEIADALTEATGIRIPRTTVADWLRELGITREDRAPVELEPA